MQRLFGISLLLIAVWALAFMTGCDDDIPETSADIDSPAADENVVAQLGANADEFEYEVGEYGGTLTFATISEPLTFNLALSNDAGSSGVLGYLFEG